MAEQELEKFFGQHLLPWQQRIVDAITEGKTVELGMEWGSRNGGKTQVDRFVQDFHLTSGTHAHWIGPNGLLCINGSCQSADDWRNRG